MQFDPLKFDEGFRVMQKIGFWFGLVASYFCWRVTMSISKKIIASKSPLRISALWGLDIFSTMLLTAIAIYCTATCVWICGIAGDGFITYT